MARPQIHDRIGNGQAKARVMGRDEDARTRGGPFSKRLRQRHPTRLVEALLWLVENDQGGRAIKRAHQPDELAFARREFGRKLLKDSLCPKPLDYRQEIAGSRLATPARLDELKMPRTVRSR